MVGKAREQLSRGQKEAVYRYKPMYIGIVSNPLSKHGAQVQYQRMYKMDIFCWLVITYTRVRLKLSHMVSQIKGIVNKLYGGGGDVPVRSTRWQLWGTETTSRTDEMKRMG